MNLIRKHRFAALTAALLTTVLFFSACSNDPTPPRESDTAPVTHAQTAPDSATEAQSEAETEAVSETIPATEAITETETLPETEAAPVVYYVCTVTEDPIGTMFREPYKTLEGAKTMCDRMAQLGYRVVSSEGELVYAPYTELQCDILRECKWVTDYVRENGFKYGDAAINPAISHNDKKVSCDRLVCWVMYRVGFTNQPRTQGVVVSAMAAWCERNGFERVTRVEDLQPGDIVLVNWNGSYPAHTFIHAGDSRNANQYYRYDCGSNARIQSVQPSSEPLTGFWRAYRAPQPDKDASES